MYRIVAPDGTVISSFTIPNKGPSTPDSGVPSPVPAPTPSPSPAPQPQPPPAPSTPPLPPAPAQKKTYYSVYWPAVSNLRQYLIDNKFWAYCKNVSSPTDLNNPEIYKRIRITPEGLHITRLKEDVNPPSDKLNGRFELRTTQQFPERTRLSFKFSVKFLTPSHCLFQVWARPANKPVQITTNNGILSYKDGATYQLKSTPAMDTRLKTGEWYEFEIRIDEVNLMIYLNGALVLTIRYPHWDSYKWIQFGDYGSNNLPGNIVKIFGYIQVSEY